MPSRRTGGRSARVVASTHAAVLDALANVGYQALSIAQIAKQAGVHETSIYRRWPTKAQLVSDVIIRSALEGVPVPDTGSFERDMVTLLQRVLDRLDTPLGVAISQVVATQEEALASLRRAYWNSRKVAMRPLVLRAIERGELPGSVQPDFAFDLFTGPILLRRIAGEAVPRKYVRKLVSSIIAGLNAT